MKTVYPLQTKFAGGIIKFSCIKFHSSIIMSQTSAVSNVADYRFVSDCRSRGHEFDPGPFPYCRKIDHEFISKVILLPSADLFKSYKRKYVLELLVNCFFKLAQEKKCG